MNGLQSQPSPVILARYMMLKGLKMQGILCILMMLCLAACSDHSKTNYNGYLDTQLVYLSADYSGRLVELRVAKGQMVDSEQLLFKLEQITERNDVIINQFNKQNLLDQRKQALIQLNYNEINYKRTFSMRQQKAASQNDVELAKKEVDTAKQQIAALDAKIQSSQATIANTQWKISRKENSAPSQGIIFDTYYNVGEFVQVGAPIVSLITNSTIKAIFFVPEEALSNLHLGAKVSIKTDVNPHFARGRISYISNTAEFSPPILYSQEERARLVFRVEAKIDKPNLRALHLGQPISLELS